MLLGLERIVWASYWGIQLLISRERLDSLNTQWVCSYLGLYLISVARGSRCLLWSRAAFSVTTGAATTGRSRTAEDPANLVRWRGVVGVVVVEGVAVVSPSESSELEAEP